MDKRVIPCAFILCCLWAHVEGSTGLPPPLNVTLHCHNMQNTLRWTYELPSTVGLQFKVIVSSLSKEPVSLLVNPPNMSVDLSEYSDPIEEYFVQVSAVKDGVESDLAPEMGIEYSYFKDATATIICNVDLPLVNLTTEDNILHYSFTHPGVLYPTKPKTRKKKSHDTQTALALFEYHIDVINQGESHNGRCTESVCQGKLPINDSKKSYCLNITGEMDKISVQATKKYCSEPLKAAGSNSLTYIIPIILVLVCGLLIGGMLFYKKTKPTASGPSSLNIRGSTPAQPQANGNDTCFVQVEPSSPDPLISETEEDTSNVSCTNTSAHDLRMRLGIRNNGNELAEVSGSQGPSEDGYTEGRYLDELNEEVLPLSSYEPRQAVENSDMI